MLANWSPPTQMKALRNAGCYYYSFPGPPALIYHTYSYHPGWHTPTQARKHRSRKRFWLMFHPKGMRAKGEDDEGDRASPLGQKKNSEHEHDCNEN
ncbi:hypothetical protein B9Z19DRAFT_1133310 [Tuber borchii]|uniref:Uncharacterized protein n=1 Tax=Tuber borchii TaxID=42251 RepID=A0A2T6ZFZ2_TUBBO|nr:hypothetical protein B9Z19DRAFT_1133310 [Tuber borchii]